MTLNLYIWVLAKQEADEKTQGLPIVMVDERMSTMVAARYLNETDTRGQKRKGVIDTLSAQIILQDALDTLKNLAKNK